MVRTGRLPRFNEGAFCFRFWPALFLRVGGLMPLRDRRSLLTTSLSSCVLLPSFLPPLPDLQARILPWFCLSPYSSKCMTDAFLHPPEHTDNSSARIFSTSLQKNLRLKSSTLPTGGFAIESALQLFYEMTFSYDQYTYSAYIFNKKIERTSFFWKMTNSAQISPNCF